MKEKKLKLRCLAFKVKMLKRLVSAQFLNESKFPCFLPRKKVGEKSGNFDLSNFSCRSKLFKQTLSRCYFSNGQRVVYTKFFAVAARTCYGSLYCTKDNKFIDFLIVALTPNQVHNFAKHFRIEWLESEKVLEYTPAKLGNPKVSDN